MNTRTTNNRTINTKPQNGGGNYADSQAGYPDVGMPGCITPNGEFVLRTVAKELGEECSKLYALKNTLPRVLNQQAVELLVRAFLLPGKQIPVKRGQSEFVAVLDARIAELTNASACFEALADSVPLQMSEEANRALVLMADSFRI